MTDVSRSRLWPSPRIRWLIWLAVVITWTVALVVPIPLRSPVVVGQVNVTFLSAKLLHALAYAVLTVLTAWLRAPTPYRIGLLLFLPIHAATTEYVQTFVGRGGSWRDVAINLSGIAVGMVLAWNWWRGTSQAR